MAFTERHRTSGAQAFEDAVRTDEGSTDPLLLAGGGSVHEQDPSKEAPRKFAWEQFTVPLNAPFRASVEVSAQGGCLNGCD